MASESHKNLAEALIAFQSSVPTIHENDKSFHGKFANLPGILSTINPALRACGLVVSQVPASVDGKPGLKTTLMHVSGESISDTTPLSIQQGTDHKGKPLNVTQEWGKASTYTRRHSLLAVLNLAIGIEDNDADAEPQVKSAPVPTPAQGMDLSASMASDDRIALLNLIKETEPAYRNKFCKAFAVKFKTGNQKISEAIENIEHFHWINEWFANNPQKTK